VSDRPPFRKILVANRGEIAVRVIRACHEMGIRTVAVYSDADREALHVRYAHEAYRIGPPPAVDSYLRIDRILEVAASSRAEAIHPGYGFLAENPSFARACRDAGFVFIGPSPEAMEALGDKVRAREIMTRAGVPVVPGSPPLPADPAEVARIAAPIGYPVLLKASAGGGGKGMRVVRRADELPSLLAQARGEARSAFADDTIFLEKYVQRPRHIEVQILADVHGSAIHLGERECSIQRRHQKLIEECPSPVVDDATRQRIGEFAVKAARASGYVNAGTVEFLRDADGSFYFMEVNARLQVEHPITELVFGVDLVKAQIAIAAGGTVPLSQEAIVPRGHAIECRIIAEDPARNFMPAPGTIRGLRTPSGPGIRYDGGTFAGWTVPVHYDPLLSKLCAWGRDRREAIDRMARALDEYRIDGLDTSISFHRKVMGHPAFRNAELHTGFLEEHPELLRVGDDPWLDEIFVVAAAVAHFRRVEAESASGPAGAPGSGGSAWKTWGRGGWRR
jgi:acetyl-CoA carboxylase biotin carboxylase subunit